MGGVGSGGDATVAAHAADGGVGAAAAAIACSYGNNECTEL